MASFVSSYIKTEGSQATRAADAASMTGSNFSSWYRADEGTLYAEATALQNGNSLVMEVNNGTAANRIFVAVRPNSIVGTNGNVFVNSVSQTGSFGSYTFSQTNKVALTYKTDDFAGTINGQTVTTDTSGTIPVVNRIDFGVNTGAPTLKGHLIKKISFYPTRLTNTQLVALTS
jgi:hypothetical protein